MAKRSKRYRQIAARIDRTRRYPLDEAIRAIVVGDEKARFD
jgi:ribosomal protein L1